MKYEPMSVRDAMAAGLQLPFALIRSLSRVTLGHTPPQIEEAELLEARFFNGAQEIRVFPGEDGLRAVRLCPEAADHAVKETCRLENRQFGSTLTITRILDWDEDGQTYVNATCLTDWKEAEGHG